MKDKKVVIVTGGTSGLGRTIVLEYAKLGYSIGFCGRRKEEGEDTVQKINDLGGVGLFVPCDVSQSEAMENFISTVTERFGPLDIAINNAGAAGTMKPLAEYPLDIFDVVVDTNLKGTFLAMKFELEVFLKFKKAGSIVNISSALGLRGRENLSVYSMTKHGIIGLTKSAALEYGKYNIRINALCPGAIETEMDQLFYQNAANPEEIKKERMKSYTLGRMASSLEVAKSCLWLAGEDASFITGAAIPVDGGKTAK
ncbi:MAG: SDR family oxidoreductase [Leptospira sp.]|jgi:NAD(P)-dependent dehydrogenase (short-subunit alcohol dehydrogenase family)|nr:SDR family oxidoreductase [Leptospira sp.]